MSSNRKRKATEKAANLQAPNKKYITKGTISVTIGFGAVKYKDKLYIETIHSKTVGNTTWTPPVMMKTSDFNYEGVLKTIQNAGRGRFSTYNLMDPDTYRFYQVCEEKIQLPVKPKELTVHPLDEVDYMAVQSDLFTKLDIIVVKNDIREYTNAALQGSIQNSKSIIDNTVRAMIMSERVAFRTGKPSKRLTCPIESESQIEDIFETAMNTLLSKPEELRSNLKAIDIEER